MATGAMLSSPGAALNALLCLTPLNLYLDKETRASLYRINAQGGLSLLSYRLRSMLDSIKESPVLCMISDIMSPLYTFDKKYIVELPSREDWLNGQVICEVGSLIWYTDGSKMGLDVGFGIYRERPKFKLIMNLGRYTSIFQSVEINLQKHYVNHKIYINSDSQAALLALRSNLVNSKLIGDCVNRLNALGCNNRVVLRWVPGHEGIVGNEIADKLARECSKCTQFGHEPFCGISRSLARLTLETLYHNKSLKI
ncbi:unnamed protein product [Parnassius apollo]|uniref:(apollo) hypothetical protein n=1 Tax=Parnassius apollo TaxID=110799 RepID=A0A8S3WY11_PARAO|nr:unnamed protein product [Parnassius apollo]